MTTATDTPEPDWYIYRGAGEPHDGIGRLPAPPPWRDFDGEPGGTVVPPLGTESTRRLGGRSGRGIAWRPEQLELINAALYLRRPLLVTGDPGSGKSTLAHAIAHELGLGRVLQWPIVSRTTLRDGLYTYDAIARLQDTQMAKVRDPSQAWEENEDQPTEDIGDYLRLGPLGTALLPYGRPRVLLVDELDKSDIDLPNDLLNALEEGEFRIAELQRIAGRQADVEVLTDDDERAVVRGGRVRCKAFPIVVMTSNGERDFPAPLLRRCLHLDLPSPRDDAWGRSRLDTMVTAHFGEEGAEVAARNGELIRTFLDSAPGSLRAADQLLNAIYLTQEAVRDREPDRQRLAELLMRPLDHGERGPGGGPL
ncbi:AAA family ATPase [Streptomyces sp. GQFP]|uniref:AAA family ATPase n=1 Tax=Streptomyces sp. GQFP TaxID=2907545 RepID=UPI001F1BAE30|nr:AAA family ATPase [Streptomyces sp. GQFP]UIX30832.1 AAA family ATPase [Streptomyces sp. GQFP]